MVNVDVSRSNDIPIFDSEIKSAMEGTRRKVCDDSKGWLNITRHLDFTVVQGWQNISSFISNPFPSAISFWLFTTSGVPGN